MVEAERERLASLARAQGATDEEIEEALAAGVIGPLAAERAIYPRHELVSFEDAVGGRDPDRAAHFWRALGFPDPRETPTFLSAAECQVLDTVFGVGLDLLGPDATEDLARVMGSSMARVAETLVDTFRVGWELPQQDAGMPYSQVAEHYVALVKEALPAFGAALAAVFQRHMIEVVYQSWAPSEEGGAVTLDRVVGFADLVGYTEAAARLSAHELSRMVSEFEQRVSHAVADHGGRLVKLIGDEAMYVTEDPSAGCAVAVALADPSLRMGLARGRVVSLRGDYYGEVVNLASRLTAAASPGEVLVSEATRDAAGDGFDFETAGPLRLKGFEGDVPAFRLRSRA